MVLRLWLIILLLIPITLVAQIVVDPTKPPAYKKQVQATEDGVDDAGDVEQGAEGEATGIPNAKVSAIFYSDTARYAIINNKVVNEGEMWRNTVLTKVLPKSIILQAGQVTREFKLHNVQVITETHEEF